MEKVYTPIEENIVFYNRAKELGYDIFFLTNYSVDGFAYLEENYDFIRNAKGKIVSSHVSCCKPEREIYELLLNKYQLNASECIQYQQYTGSQGIRINAVLFTDVQEALRLLQ